jgi:hypothetical protein
LRVTQALELALRHTGLMQTMHLVSFPWRGFFLH